MEDLVIDNAGVRVINGTVSANQELGDLGLVCLSVGSEKFTELGVRLEDVWDTLGGIETGNLDDVFTARPLEFVRLLLDAHAPEFAHVVLSVPDAKFLVQTIKPISGSTQEGKGFDGDIVWNEVAHRMADEDIRVLDVIPEVIPNFFLGRTLLVDKVTADLDVGTVDNWEVWASLLD